MIFDVNRLEMLAAVRDAEAVAPEKSPMDVLQCAFLSAENGTLTVAATNLEQSLERRIPAEIAEEGSILLKAKQLTSMLRLLAGERVTFTYQDHGYVEIRSDHAFYRVPTDDVSKYPRMEIPFPEDMVVVTDLPAMARRTVFAVDTGKDAKPVMRCVHLVFSGEDLKAVSSDGFRVAAAKGTSKSASSADLLVPAASLEKLARLVGNKDELKVGTTGKTVVFLKDGFAFSARLMEGSYFDDTELMSRFTSQFTVLTDADTLKKVLTSVYAMTGLQNRFSISFAGSILRMTCESEYGSSSAKTEVVPLSGNPTGVYWYNPGKLLDCLKAQSGTLMVDVMQNGMLTLKTDELICMQAPMREPKAIARKTTQADEPGKKSSKNTKKKAAADIPAAA